MADENRFSPGYLGDDGQLLGSRTAQVDIDLVNPLLPAPQQPEIESPSREPSPRPDPPSRSSSSSSSAVSDDRTELQHFIQNMDGGEEDADHLDAILQKLDKDQTHQRSHYDGDQNAMHMAADRGMLWAVKQLLDYTSDDTSLLSETDGDGRQPLHLACLRGHKDTAELLLQRGADIEAKQSSGATPLDEACWKGHKHVVEFLLSSGADTQVIDNDGWSPIRSATEYERLAVVETLLNENPANINVGDDYGETPLHVASGKGYTEVIRLLLERGADVDNADKDGETPLHAASRNGHDDSARLLLKEQAHIDKADNNGETPLHAASQNGYHDVVDVLLEEHAGVNVTDKDGKTPLYAASQQGHPGVIRLLLGQEVDINKADNGGGTPLYVASREGHQEIVILLLGHEEVKLNVTDGHHRTPVMVASQNGHIGCVNSLCEAGADCNLQADKDEGNKTALHYAFEPSEQESEAPKEKEQNQYRVVVKLLKHRADPGIQNDKGETALHLAGRSGDSDAYRDILKMMKDGQNKLKSQEEDTALGLALKACPTDILELMMDKQSAELFDWEDETEALLWASQHEKNHHCAERLFEERKHFRHKMPLENSDSWSAIQWAAYLELPSVLWLLLATSQPLGAQKARKLALKEAENQSSKVEKPVKEEKGLEDTKPAGKSTRREAQSKGEGEERKEEGGTEKQGDPRTTDKQKTRSTRQKPKDLVLLILRNPPPTITSGEEEKLERPRADTKQEGFLKHWGSKAAVIEYREKHDKSTLFTQFRSVQDVIYRTGPAGITKEREETLERMKAIKGSQIFQKICKLQEERLGDGLFTWVHLPATSDLLKRIVMDDSQWDGLPSEGVGDLTKLKKASTVNSFFKASWSQIPDRTSESRIMKPLCITEPMPQAKKDEGSPGRSPGSNVDSPDRFLHAIYIPYLTLSRQRRGQDLKRNNDLGGKEPQKEEEKGEKGSNEGEEKDGRDQEEADLRGAYGAYNDLLTCYEDTVIHGSATLDESFYHFSSRQQKPTQQQEAQHDDQEYDDQEHDDQEHAAQQEDRQRRNENQVVTKGIHPEGVTEKSCWTLVRVNQLWVWIIGHKWLITATTHPIDQTEDPFLTDLLDHIEKRAKAEGREVRSRSPLEMAKTIVEYCVDSYDRQPKSTVYGTNHSIRQIFSDSINKIAREDARLFEDFYKRIEAKQPKKKDKLDVKESTEPGKKGEDLKKGGKVKTNERIEEAIKAAARLSAEIRDIRDELQMLQAIAKHQVKVQKKLENGSSADNGLWESYVMSDIGDMIRSADRIKSNVEMTLSLEQSQIANNQAKESVWQGGVANEQAIESVQQGRTLMIFTAITAFFVGVPGYHPNRIYK
ncbi:hypothetical protein QQX98_009811 [Neonectria punicea]|uniref:Uncharacterized protein n=1 Tax=Neonectria punicea TaxID=979145 RepID=A0ABR1GRM6_9HYPO